MALPCFSNRRLEINSTLVWPETLVELNMNDWDCSSTCCWERDAWWLLGIWGFFIFSFLPAINSQAILCCSYSWPDGWATLFCLRSLCSLWTCLIGIVWICHFVFGTEQWPVRSHDLIEQIRSWTSQSSDSSGGKKNQPATPILHTQQQQHLNMKEPSGYQQIASDFFPLFPPNTICAFFIKRWCWNFLHANFVTWSSSIFINWLSVYSGKMSFHHTVWLKSIICKVVGKC